MKRIIILLALVLLPVIGLSMQAGASGPLFMQNDGANLVEKDKTIDGSAYMAGDSVRIEGTVNGDIYCAAKTVVVSGTVNGDVICAASSLRIEGTLNGDARVAAETVELGGKISGNVTAVGANVNLLENLVIENDLTAFGSVVKILGTVNRDATVGAEEIALEGNIGRDANFGSSRMGFGDQAKIGGDLNYRGDEDQGPKQGVVAGSVSFGRGSYGEAQAAVPGILTLMTLLTIILAIGFIVFLGALVAPKLVHKVASVSYARFGIAFVAGLAWLVVTPIIMAFLVFSGIGFVVAYILLLVWLLSIAASPVFVGYFIGHKICGSKTNNVLVRATTGALVLIVLMAFPILNVVVFIGMILVGTGLQILAVPSSYRGHTYQIKDVKEKGAKVA